MSNNVGIRNHSGQATIEAALISLGLVSFVSLFFVAIYMIYASYWAEHIMYESLICYQERGQKYYCLQKAKDQIRTVLFFEDSFKLKINSRGSYMNAELSMRVNPIFLGEKNFKFTKAVRF